MDDQQLLQHIVYNPNIMSGKPVIKGTRLTVDYILNLLAHGSTEADIIKEYQGITGEQIKACIFFAMKSLENTEFMPLSPEKEAG
jgi:uncharacterized protein (DUF433 family)